MQGSLLFPVVSLLSSGEVHVQSMTPLLDTDMEACKYISCIKSKRVLNPKVGVPGLSGNAVEEQEQQQWQKTAGCQLWGLSGYCFQHIDRIFCLWTKFKSWEEYRFLTASWEELKFICSDTVRWHSEEILSCLNSYYRDMGCISLFIAQIAQVPGPLSGQLWQHGKQ